MARCGCENSCDCCVTGGDGITVTGTGGVGNCYDVSMVDPVVAHVDSDCIALSGDGVVGSELEASIIISPDAGNTLECRANGSYAPASSVGAPTIYGLMDLTGAYITPGATPNVVVYPWPYNTVVQDVGGVVNIALSQFLIPAGGAGWYTIECQWLDDSIANNFEATPLVDYHQQRYGPVITSAVAASNRPTINTQDRLVEESHAYRVSTTVFLAAGDTVDFYWEIVDSAGGACSPMSFTHAAPPAGSPYPNWASIVRIGV